MKKNVTALSLLACKKNLIKAAEYYTLGLMISFVIFLIVFILNTQYLIKHIESFSAPLLICLIFSVFNTIEQRIVEKKIEKLIGIYPFLATQK